MKKKILVAAGVIFIAGFVSQLFAQETTDQLKSKTKSNQSNDRSADQNNGVCTGKIRCADGSCVISFDQEIVSPRDAASGLPTGKRMHKPFVITKELDKSSPVLAKGGSGLGAGKATFSDLSIMINVQGKSRKIPVVNGQFALPNDCPDGACDLIVSWSWGESNSGTTSGTLKKYEATVNLDVENGEFMASKKNYVGHITLMK